MVATKIRLATASPATASTNEATLRQLEGLAIRAASAKADVLLLPEAYLGGGYPRGSDFGCKVGGRTAEGRDQYLEYFRRAVDLGDSVGVGGAGGGREWVRRSGAFDLVGEGRGGKGDEGRMGRTRGDGTREELERFACETGVFIVVGLVEKAGGSLYCAAVYVCPRLGVIGKRRKVLPTGSERLIWAQGSPATLKAVSTTIRGVRINLAAAICWENYMPLLRQSLYAQNVNLYLAPTADGRDTWLPLMRTIAFEGRCFVVTSNMCVREGGKQHVDETAGANGVPNHSSDDGGVEKKVTARRNSCLTEDGFEIALPSPPPAAATRTPKIRQASRKSLFDDDEDGRAPVLLGEQQQHASGGHAIGSSAVVEEGEREVGEEDESPVEHESQEPTPARIVGEASSSSSSSYLSRGGSSIVSPFGDVLAGPQWEDEEGIIHADVDFEDCIRGRLDLDAAGSYSRNDSFKLSVEGLDLDPLPYF